MGAKHVVMESTRQKLRSTGHLTQITDGRCTRAIVDEAMCADISRSSRFRPGYSRCAYNNSRLVQNALSPSFPSASDPTVKRKKYLSECERKVRTVYRGGRHNDRVDDLCGRVRRNLHVKRNTVSETAHNGSGEFDYYVGDDFVLEEPFSDSGDDSVFPRGTHLSLPLPRRRIRTLSGMIPPIGYSPTWGGPTMCLQCLEFFDVSKNTENYVAHLLEKHKIVISDIKLIVDLKRYIEYWRHRFGETPIENIFPLVVPEEGDPRKGMVDSYYLMSPKLPEDLQIRERLALRRLEEVLSCQQRERLDRTFDRVCLFCRYRVKGNRSKLIHHLYLIHQLNLGSPDNLVFVAEYLDLLASKIKKNQCIYCENSFENHDSLMEHMRKKQHREVNPKNLYYDKFYVINYLELGKKWLDVLAEDFEDTMPTFIDSDEEEEEETWNEWQEDNTEETGETVICLFCDVSFEDGASFLAHIKESHHFDLPKVFDEYKTNFYDRVKFINYVRKMSHNCICFACGKDDLHSWVALRKHLAESNAEHFSKIPDRSEWDKEEYLVPTYENDNLLCLLDDLEGLRNGSASSSGKNNSSTTEQANKEDGPQSTAVPVDKVICEDPPDLSASLLKDPAVLEELQ